MLHLYLRRYALTLLVTVCILCLSLMHVPEIKHVEGIPLIDKWTHMVMYGALSFVLGLEYRRSHEGVGALKSVLLFAAPVALGGIMELAQACLTTYRSGEWLDFLANTMGVCLGFTATWAAVRLFPRIAGK